MRRRVLIPLLAIAGALTTAAGPAVVDPDPFPVGACVRASVVSDDHLCVYVVDPRP